VGGLRLQHRIVIPFVAISLASTGAAAYVTWSVTSAALQTRLRTQLRNAATVISRGDLALNRAILRNLQEVVGAHIITFGEDGRIVASTATDEHHQFVDAARRSMAAGPAPGPEPVVATADCGRPCVVAWRQLEGRPGMVVALVAETSELSTAMRAVSRAILLAAALSVLLIVIVSQIVVRRVTAPLDRLIRFASEPSPARSRRADVGRGEIGDLAEAFNGMLDRLERSQDALVRSEKLALAGLIAARVAHDIRNPLSSIKMQTQLLTSRLDRDAEAVSALTAVLHDIDQMESVIRDLLELARPGQFRLERASLNGVIRSALQQLSAQFNYRKISVEIRLDERAPDLLLDQHRLRQALLNVLLNASEAMPTGGTVTITSRVEGDVGAADAGPAAPRSVVVEVCDDGIGVDPGMVDRVFDPFVSSKREGVGLGLVNAKAVVEGHGGAISLGPRHGRGTCVTIRLPVSPAATSESGGS
jgi:signal transduction histidine kinase